MLIVIDTNVIWQAFHNANGLSGFILDLVIDEKLDIALSDPIFTEYIDVLLRPSSINKFKATPEDVLFTLDGLAGMGKWHMIWFRFRPNLRDEADNMFVEVAVTSGADFLITNNIRDFTQRSDLRFDDLNIITPKDFITLWRDIINE